MLTSGTCGGAQPPPIPCILGESVNFLTLTSATREEEILGERVNYLTLKQMELVGAQPSPIPYILREMLTPI